jgi:hypothetical protein
MIHSEDHLVEVKDGFLLVVPLSIYSQMSDLDRHQIHSVSHPNPEMMPSLSIHGSIGISIRRTDRHLSSHRF